MEFNKQVLWLQHIPNSFCLLSQHYSNPRSLLAKKCELFLSAASLTFSSFGWFFSIAFGRNSSFSTFLQVTESHCASCFKLQNIITMGMKFSFSYPFARCSNCMMSMKYQGNPPIKWVLNEQAEMAKLQFSDPDTPVLSAH